MKYKPKRKIVRFVIPLLLVGVAGIRFVQRSSAQTQTLGDQNPKAAQVAKNPIWSPAWKKFFARYEVVLKRPLTPQEQQGLAAAYRNYRQNIAGVLGLKLSELTSKEQEAVRAKVASMGRSSQAQPVTEPASAQ